MKEIELKKTDSCCNAAEVVFSAFGHVPVEAESLNLIPEKRCKALAAALALCKTENEKQAVEAQFLKIMGATTCGMLNGVRCWPGMELSKRLVEQQKNRQDPNGKPRVLLIGDSIRMGYQDAVAKELEGEFQVVAPKDNTRFAKYLLNELERIFQECGEPDIIHWNAGLWDTAIVCPEDGMFTRPEEYVYYMERLQRELLKHTPKVIFATTTPVGALTVNQNPEFVKELNQAVVRRFAELNVTINDLYSVVEPNIAEWLGPDNIHLSSIGVQNVAKIVADKIRAIA